MADDTPDLSDLAQPGATIAVRVTPGARSTRIERDDDGLRIWVTAPPDGGRANAAVTETLARALGVAKTRLTLLRGATSRQKLFRLDP
jgi:uncharacterized protein YggU (UPF0235/DUF167 family)